MPNEYCERLNFFYRLIPKIAKNSIYLTNKNGEQRLVKIGKSIKHDFISYSIWIWSRSHNIFKNLRFHFFITLTFFLTFYENRFRIAFWVFLEWWMGICANEYAWIWHWTVETWTQPNSLYQIIIQYAITIPQYEIDWISFIIIMNKMSHLDWETVDYIVILQLLRFRSIDELLQTS